MKIDYYRGKETGRNQAAVVVVAGSWPPRVLDHRGLTVERRVWSREATDEEVKDVSTSTRCLSWSYKSHAELLADEGEILRGQPQELASLLTMFPLDAIEAVP